MGDGRARRRPRGDLRPRAARPGGGARRRAAGPDRARDRRRGARSDRRRGPRRPLRPRARARGGARGPRGAAPRPLRQRHARGGQRGDRRTRRLRARPRRRADRGSRCSYQKRARCPQSDRQGPDDRQLRAQGCRTIRRYGRGMTSLVRIRPYLRLAAFVAALCALLAPATAGASVHAHAAAKKKKAKPPVVTSVRPMNVEIGQTLEIRGKYFIRGRYKNTVAFKRDGGKAVFAKAKIGTTKLLRITVPAKLKTEFKRSGYFYVPTRFRVRVLAKKFGKKFTAASKSPLVALKPGTSPVAVAPPAPPANTAAEGDCDKDGTVNSADSDDDNDLLPDSLENAINATLVAKYGP